MMRQLTGETKTTHGLGMNAQQTPGTGNGNARPSPRGSIGAYVSKAGARLGAWLVVAAASLAVAGPANAQEGAEIWSATLNVKDVTNNTFGCHNLVSGKECDESSILSDDDFMLGSADIAVESVGLNTGGLSFIVSPASGSEAFRKMTLHVGSTAMTFASASHSTVTNGDGFVWTMTGLNWSDGDTVQLRITEQPSTPELLVAGAHTDGSS